MPDDFVIEEDFLLEEVIKATYPFNDGMKLLLLDKFGNFVFSTHLFARSRI